MGLIAKDSGGGNFTPVSPGMHLARCYRIVDMGTQTTDFAGQTKHLQKVMLQFEVHGEDDSGKPLVTAKGEPMSISKNFTLSLAEKATLRLDLQAWRGRPFTADELRGFELKAVLGVWAMITAARALGKNGKEFTNIVSINPVPAAIKRAGLPEGFNKLGSFDIDNPNMDLFETFGNGLREKITSSPEWRARNVVQEQPVRKPTNTGSGFDDMDDDSIPF
jgi:hypothetical protein